MMKKISLYVCGSSFTIVEQVLEDKFAVHEGVTKTMLPHYTTDNKKDREAMIKKAVVIGGVIHRVDYLQKEATTIALSMESDNKLYLVVLINPSKHWKMDDIEVNQPLLDEYFNEIHDGKLEDIIDIIALTALTGEKKRNNLIYVAPSNVGKTEAIEHASFTTMTGKQFNDSIKAETGLSKEMVKELNGTGLLLVDDFSYIPTIELKTSTDTTAFRVMNKGTQRLPTKMKVFTTTDVSKSEKLTEELWNRFYVVVADNKGLTVPKSKFYEADPDEYRRQTTHAVRKLIIKAFEQGADYKKLSELQEKYSPKHTSEIPEMFEAIIKDVLEDLELIRFTNDKLGVIGKGIKKSAIKPSLEKYLDGDYLADKDKHINDIFMSLFTNKSSGYLKENGKKEKSVYYLKEEHYPYIEDNNTEDWS